MRIDAVLVDDVPLGVDTPHDLERAREIIACRNGIAIPKDAAIADAQDHEQADFVPGRAGRQFPHRLLGGGPIGRRCPARPSRMPSRR